MIYIDIYIYIYMIYIDIYICIYMTYTKSSDAARIASCFF